MTCFARFIVIILMFVVFAFCVQRDEGVTRGKKKSLLLDPFYVIILQLGNVVICKEL